MEDKGDYKPHEEETKWQSFKKMLWNSETQECLGRTGLSWFKITLFYIIFYACLAAFWSCMLVVFYQTLENDQPKWKLDSSRIGSSPGLGFRPSPPDENIDSTLIWFNTARNDTIEYWVHNLDSYLEPYSRLTTGQKVSKCGDSMESASKDKSCVFEYDSAKQDGCNSANTYGYLFGEPCVLVKLNRIYDWVPEPYDSSNCPDELKKLLNRTSKTTDVSCMPDEIYITCIGENSADKDNIGELEYYPSQSIKSHYFPFLNQKGYVSPFVFVKFSKINKGVLVNVECRAWAKNIKFDRGDRLGSVHFELLVD